MPGGLLPFGDGEAEFPQRALSDEILRQLEGGAGPELGTVGSAIPEGGKPARDENADGLVEAEAGAELTGSGTDDSGGGGQDRGAQAVELDGEAAFAGG